MLNVKVKILEGINIYSEYNAVCLRLEDINSIHDFIRMIQCYKHIENILELKGKVEIINYGDTIEAVIKENDVYECRLIVVLIIEGKDIDSIIKKVNEYRANDWSRDLREEAEGYGVPFINEGKDEIILGYGIKSLRITRSDYDNIYKKNNSSILEMFKKDKGIIPIVAVSGTNGKTTTVRLIHKVLIMLGYNSGLSSTGGIYIGEEAVKYGDTTGFYSAREVLKNKNIDVAVLETARGGILKKGLGYKKAKVAVITSISEDHIGMEGIKTIEDLVKIKSLITEELDNDGIAVVKAIPILAEKLKEKNNVILFDDKRNEVIDRHINDGKTAYYVENNFIIKNAGSHETRVINVNDIPFAFNGISKSNLRNIIATIIAAEYITNDLEGVVQCVKQLECNITTNLGRQNIIDFNKFKMIIDYGHNSEAFREVFSIAESIPHNRIIGLITAAGDRKDRYIKELGEIAARYCSKIIIKEQPDLRGRKQGETAELLRCGALDGGINEEDITIILNEEDAILHALRGAENGDIIISFSQFLYLTFPAINIFRKENYMEAIGDNIILVH